jgi:UDP-glucose 4-epimerase
MATYLVTGGCGFIGSHLCGALIARGDNVRIIDDLSSGSIGNVPPQADLVRGDVADLDTVKQAMMSVDGCFHLAAIASVERCTRDWLGTHRTNQTGAITVFEAARLRSGRNPIPIVYASSAAIYGECASLPSCEAGEKTPRSAYGADKYGCEVHARIATELYRIPTIGLRFFNVYGPRQDPNSPYAGVISLFCKQLRQGDAIDIFGSGAQTRDFIFVDDVVTALLRAMEAKLSHPAVFNVCTGIPTSILELARLIAELCGVDARIRFKSPRSGEIIHSFGASNAACLELGFSAATELRSGLRATLAWMNASDNARAG